MKKITLIALALIAGISMSQAQENKGGWGVRGGFNFPMDGLDFSQAGENINSIFTGENLSNGWHAGLYGRAYLNDRFFVGSNLLYMNSKSTLTGKTGDETFSETLNRSAAQLDLLTGMQMLGFLRVQGGVNGLMYLDNTWTDSFNTFGAGYTVGVGADIWKFGLDVTYNGSFNSQTGTWKGIPLNYNRSDLMVGLSIKL
jgi:hypothetical protein